MKRFSQAALMLLLAVFASVNLSAQPNHVVSGQTSTLTGRVFQIEPTAIYVEASGDHTAYKVPRDGTFRVGGKVIDVNRLRVGDPVSVTYIPEQTVVMPSPSASP